MLKSWLRYLHYSVYRKILVSYVLLIALTVSFVSILLFMFYSKNATNEIVKTSTEFLAQTSYTSDLIYERVISIGSELLTNNNIINLMHSKKPDRLLEFRVIRELLQLQNNYPFIKYINIYNQTMDRYISTRGISPHVNDELIQHINENKSYRYLEFMPRRIMAPYVNNTKTFINVLSFILYPKYFYSQPSQGAIIIDIDEAYIRNTMQAMQNKNDNVFIIDENGIILSHTDQRHYLKDFSSLPYINDIINAADNKGYFVTTIDEKKHLVIFVKSETLNWFFVNVKPYDLIFFHTMKLQNITFIISLLFILSGVLLSFWLSQSIYNPLGTLLNRINAIQNNQLASQKDEVIILSDTLQQYQEKTNLLESYIKDSLPVLQKTHIRCLLKGNLAKFDRIEQILESLQSYLCGPNYTVLCIEIDNYDNFVNRFNAEDRELYYFALCNALEECLNRFSRADVVIVEGKEITLLLQHSSNNVSSEIFIAVDEILQAFYRNFKFSFSAGIGETVTEHEKLHYSYTSAQEYIAYRFFFGPCSIIDSTKVRSRKIQSDKYPYSIEKKIMDAINLTDASAVREGIIRFKKQMESMSYYHAVTYSHLLALSILKQFNQLIKKDMENSHNHYLFKQLSNQETLDSIMDSIQHLCLEICTQLNELKHQKNKHVIEKIQSYVQEHYADPNLSIDQVADIVHLSPGYVGKLFRSTNEYTFNDFVNKVRLEKARELLVTTDQSIAAISKKVGINNTTYFFTLFKKTFGITPTQYRAQSKQQIIHT